MKTFEIEIDGKKIQTHDGPTILQVARQNDIDIPTLCYSETVKPSGACRMCMVEITKNSRTRLVASCVYPVAENLIVKTDTEKLKKIRRLIVELLWSAVPEEMTEKYGPQKYRYPAPLNNCTLCGLCVRYCRQVAKKHAAYFKGRGVNREIAIIPELTVECSKCSKCFNICTGGSITDLYEKTESQNPAPVPHQTGP
jgi:bidirectional [NiFe] hydrogenase diaphorase subunit